MAIKKTRQRVREKSLNSGEQITKQSFAKQTNINNIMAKYQKTGHIPQVTAQPAYGDTAAAGDYLTAMNVVVKAQQQFDSLPAAVRKEFGHDPSQFLDFMSKSENTEKMIEMGLATRQEAAPETLNVEAVEAETIQPAPETTTEPAQ